MEFEGTVEKFENNLWYYHIKIPPFIADQLKSQNIKRFLCRINNGQPFHSSMMPEGNGKYFIILGKERRSENKIKLGSQIMVTISPDNSKYGMEMPEEFAELLNQDPEGDKLFHSLTPGKQRSLIFIVGKLKNQDKRIQKAFIIIEHLKEYQGNLDYRQLNEDFKSKKDFF